MQANTQPKAKKTTRSTTRMSASERAARRAQLASKSLNNALTRDSMMNYESIFEGFAAKGIPIDQVEPRQNVFTFNAWRALGRTVRKGESGVAIVTIIEGNKNVKGSNGEMTQVQVKKPVKTYVFHISQTDELPQDSTKPEAH